jgi:hypothetical protein
MGISKRRLAKLKIKELQREYCRLCRREDGNVMCYIDSWVLRGMPRFVDDLVEHVLVKIRKLSFALRTPGTKHIVELMEEINGH